MRRVEVRKFIQFKTLQDKDIFVNPDHVAMIWATADQSEEQSLVVLVGGTEIKVKDRTDDILRRIQNID
jgi:hypothetical protein